MRLLDYGAELVAGGHIILFRMCYEVHHQTGVSGGLSVLGVYGMFQHTFPRMGLVFLSRSGTLSSPERLMLAAPCRKHLVDDDDSDDAVDEDDDDSLMSLMMMIDVNQ